MIRFFEYYHDDIFQQKEVITLYTEFYDELELLTKLSIMLNKDILINKNKVLLNNHSISLFSYISPTYYFSRALLHKVIESEFVILWDRYYGSILILNSKDTKEFALFAMGRCSFVDRLPIKLLLSESDTPYLEVNYLNGKITTESKDPTNELENIFLD